MTPPDLRFPTSLRLKSRSHLQALFEDAPHCFVYPLRVQFRLVADPALPPLQVAFSVPKRRFRKAVDRNRVRRLLREAWRLQRARLSQALTDRPDRLQLILIYTGKPEDATHPQISRAVGKVLRRLYEQVGVGGD
jgi:ribonuclease P protein component